MFPIRCLILLALSALPGLAIAQSASLFPHGDGAARAPLIPARATALSGQARAASLFAGNGQLGFFAPLPDRSPPPQVRASIGPLSGSGAAAQLRSLIAEAESGADSYDAVIHGARIRPPGRPTDLTVQQVYDWIAATPGQPHAIGRYQFIPVTLRRLVDKVGVSPATRFDAKLQDRLADELLAEAGMLAFQRGELTRRSFMYRLAKIWAGLPLPSGESYYEGYAGNKATMTWARFDGAMAQIFPG
ncbi:hypothetical protein [Antarctobacter heliothermus]|uniref:Uncharacterized protein n=1 Tax=Antarctobacter heliothermus TaxID=74033 RepID=A0A239L2N2_9RHOB|nr:hypothetical protein [Antarctobacter heliothermus]SNT24856.1 hypothetical protein SAMN04488078_10789 [Antarctobacter heliothermus]